MARPPDGGRELHDSVDPTEGPALGHSPIDPQLSCLVVERAKPDDQIGYHQSRGSAGD